MGRRGFILRGRKTNISRLLSYRVHNWLFEKPTKKQQLGTPVGNESNTNILAKKHFCGSLAYTISLIGGITIIITLTFQQLLQNTKENKICPKGISANVSSFFQCQ